MDGLTDLLAQARLVERMKTLNEMLEQVIAGADLKAWAEGEYNKANANFGERYVAVKP